MTYDTTGARADLHRWGNPGTVDEGIAQATLNELDRCYEVLRRIRDCSQAECDMGEPCGWAAEIVGDGPGWQSFTPGPRTALGVDDEGNPA